jgi:hypothetical protein
VVLAKALLISPGCALFLRAGFVARLSISALLPFLVVKVAISLRPDGPVTSFDFTFGLFVHD